MKPIKTIYASAADGNSPLGAESTTALYFEDSAEEASNVADAEDGNEEIVLEYTLTRILRVKSKPVVEVVTDYTKPKTKGAKK